MRFPSRSRGIGLAAFVGSLAVTGGCGYVGDPLPPALHIPRPVENLTATQRGAELIIQFTIPALTTEDLPLRLREVDIRIGVAPAQDVDIWAANAMRVPVQAAGPGAVRTATPVEHWIGREVLIAARAESHSGRPSAWSSPVSVNVIAPLDPPSGVRAASHPKGVLLRWDPPARPGLRWRIYQRNNGEFTEAGLTDKPEFVAAAAFGKGVSFRIEALQGAAASVPSEPVSITPEDKFAPVSPTGLTPIAGLNSIELSWDRSPDADTKGYRVYRAEDTGPFSPVAALVEAPVFSDKSVTAGRKYRYRITSLDVKGNESAPSSQVEIIAQ